MASFSLSFGFAFKALSHNVCKKYLSMNGIDDVVIVVDPAPNQSLFNFAHMWAEALNGGISQYQEQLCMYSRQLSKDCFAYEKNGFTYQFLGASPCWDWEFLKLPPMFETEIRIYTDAKTKA